MVWGIVNRLREFLEECSDNTRNLVCPCPVAYEVVSKSFRTGRLEPELQVILLSATKCSCIAIL
jgi:hypothetical protein